MNQILVTSNEPIKDKKSKVKKQRNAPVSGPANIVKIIRFFCITILVFGVILLGQGSYAIYKTIVPDSENNNTVQEGKLPEIYAEKIDNSLVINIYHTNDILKISYKWNNEAETVIPVSGRRDIEEIISIPSGDNTFSIEVIDTLGKKATFQEKYYIEENLDKTKPVIDVAISSSTNSLIISVTDDVQLSYVTYKWGTDEETRVDVNAQNPKKIEISLPITQEERMLSVKAVDANGNIATLSLDEPFKGVYPPTITVCLEGDHVVIEAVDSEKMKEVECIINGQTYTLQFTDETGKIVKYAFPLIVGHNTVEVKAINARGFESTFSGVCEYP